MKKYLLVSFAALAVGSACGDGSAPGSTEPKLAPGGLVKDDIYNTLDLTIDSDVEALGLTVGTDGTASLQVQPRNEPDTENGCNFQKDQTLTVDVVSSDPTVATVTAGTASLTFGSCGDVKSVTIHPIKPGSTTISLTLGSNNTGGTFDLAPASFTVNVSAAPVTDATAPLIGYVLSPPSPDGSAGWYKRSVSVDWTVTDGESSISSSTGCSDFTISGDQQATTYTCSATSAGGTRSVTTVGIQRDATAPSVQYASETGADGSNGWYINPVTVTFTGSDVTSGLSSLTQTANSGTSEGATVTVSSPIFTDNAGNTSVVGAASGGPYKVDLSDPTNVTFTGTTVVADGGSYYFGSVPAAPTCSADDAISGMATCVVTGYSTAVGSHTLTATANDNAGRTSTATRSYTVLAWTLRGFYQPIDLNGVLNIVKGGLTVPLKFEIFAGSNELSATSAVKGFSAVKIACTANNQVDDIEFTTTGGTSLRYDDSAGQFIQNWQTPKLAGTCFRVTLETLDGSKTTALLQLK